MSEVKPTQQCTICGAIQPLSARTCTICGARLAGQPTPSRAMPPVARQVDRTSRPRFDPAEGDDDLYASDLTGRMWRLALIIGIVLALLLGIGIGVVISRMSNDSKGDDLEVFADQEAGTVQPTIPPTATLRQAVASTPTVSITRQPTLAFATITPMPPSPTETPTPGPCMQTAQEGDTIYGMAIRCGHQDMAVVDLILELNDMDSPTELQLGQTLEIPWPTPTPGGEATQPPVDESGGEPVSGETSSSEGTPVVLLNEFGTPDALATYQMMEPTLRPGQAWHVVQSGETIITIAVLYDAGLETLSQINPEIPFLQCDYGSPTGGPNCAVMLYEGQRVRVPVPLPTQTYTPTPIGTLTPTPTATATFNAPYLLTPDDGAHFNADEIVTLRWGGTGTLATNERYVVRVRDTTAGQEYVATTAEMAYILPGGWQPADRNCHTFEWTISVATVDAQNTIQNEDHKVGPREFTWDSR